MSTEHNSVSDILEDNTYKFGFTTDVESETFAKGLDEDEVIYKHGLFVDPFLNIFMKVKKFG